MDKNVHQVTTVITYDGSAYPVAGCYILQPEALVPNSSRLFRYLLMALTLKGTEYPIGYMDYRCHWAPPEELVRVRDLIVEAMKRGDRWLDLREVAPQEDAPNETEAKKPWPRSNTELLATYRSLGFSPRLSSNLAKLGVPLEKLLWMSDEELFALRGIGPVLLEEILRWQKSVAAK